METIETLDPTPFKHLVMTIGNLPSSFVDSMTYYECLAWLVKYLENTVIPAVNSNAEALDELQTAFVTLKDYVDNYFDNLDVQQEINNKLDEMAQDGSLGTLLERFVQPYIDAQNAQIADLSSSFNTLQQRVNSSISNSPVPVASQDDMTDHNTVYVLTTTGHWFYYDEDESGFVDGGAYQSAVLTGIDSDSIEQKGIYPVSLANISGYDLAADYHVTEADYQKDTWTIDASTGRIGLDNSAKSVMQRIPHNSWITVSRSVLTDRFRIGLSNSIPQVNSTVEIILNDATKEFCTFYNESYDYMLVMYTITSEEATVSIKVDCYDNIKDSIGVENLMPFSMAVPAYTELYNASFKKKDYGTGGDDGYPYQNYPNLYSYKFALEPNLNYTIVKNGTSNRFRVTLYHYNPTVRVANSDTGANYLTCRPSKVVINDAEESTCTFASEDYKFCIITYNLGTLSNEVSFNISADGETHKLSTQYYDNMLELNGGVYIFNPTVDGANDFWSMWSGRLAFGMNTSIAPIPVQMESQLFVNGTIMSHVQTDNANAYNRWGYHVYEAYAKDNYSRMTMLLNKHDSEFDSKPSLEFYYYTGASHDASAYGNTKIGSDVNKHSFLFSRDKMIANGTIDCTFPIQLARIVPSSDLDNTYASVAQADSAYEAENYADQNIKCIKWIALKNAPDGTMFYDNAREKVVVKVNGTWSDVQTTPVPSGTYNFE